MNNPFETHGAFSWTELMTRDVPAARTFYGDLLGWKFKEMNSTGFPYAVIRAAEQDIGGMMTAPPEVSGMPPYWGTYVTVTNVDEVAARALSLGGKVLVEPTQIPTVGRFAVTMDPQGATLSVITYKPR